MEDRKIKDIYGCDYIQDNGELYPLQRWYNQTIDKNVSEISVADVLRMMRQNEFMELAISRAIAFLRENPFEGEQYEGELLGKVSTIENHLIKDYLDDLRYILVHAKKENEVYEWLIEKEREEFQEIIDNFSRIIDGFHN